MGWHNGILSTPSSYLHLPRGRRGVVEMLSSRRPGGYGFDTHCGSVLQISLKDIKYSF
ncbi:hypothetical protein DPMN_163108 [Dreissena polymorpha]|uniref:Uncharacterized protein n=1 Tax=Dreissena polymorpha TaxID=45954 RepID=A0A9D4EVZ3_DREPO|nr:hypothetical protein DPMN_163108 [Dreissena polymorpha]